MSYGYFPLTAEEENILVGPLNGHYTLDEALTALLPPGFTHGWINDSTTMFVASPVVITQPAMPAGTFREMVGPPRETSKGGSKLVEGILVRDSRIWSEQFDVPSGVEFDRRDIEALGVSTMAEVLEYLPQQPYAYSSGFRISGEQYADLRGLGPSNTLVLINGRRVTASATSFDANAFDLNTIPLVAVERIEVVTDVMSVAAGADAIAGSINIVLKDHFARPVVEARYGTASGGAEELRLSLGGEWSTQRLHVSGVLDYLNRYDLLGAERDLWRDQDYRRFGSTDMRSPDSNPGNITSITAANLPGLPARFAAVPQQPGASLGPEDFMGGAGQRNLGSLFRYRSILPEADRWSAVGSARFVVSDENDLFGEFLFTDRTSTLRDLPVTLSGVFVPADNAFNPFDVPVRANVRLDGIGEHLQTTQARFARTVVGMHHQGEYWSGEIFVQHTDESARLTTRNEVDPMRVAAALAQSDPNQALNVFTAGPGADGDLLGTLLAAPFVREFASRETLLSAVLRGPALALPAGEASILFGAQWRQPQIELEALARGTAQRDIASTFADLRLPLIDKHMRVPGLKELALTLSSRLDRYSDVDTTVNSQAALTGRPASNLLLRAAYGTGFRAPSLYELYQPTTSFPFTLADPKRNNAVSDVIVSVGGNRDLNETTSRSWSLGMTFKEPALADLELTLNAWHVEMENRVAAVTLPALFAHENLYGDRVMRAAPSEADILSGLPGRLTALDLTPANLGRLRAAGIDAGVTFRFETPVGYFSPALSATWMDQFTTVDLPGMEAQQRVGTANVFGTIPKWRAVARIGWAQHAASAFTAVRFLSQYDDVNVLQNRLNGREISSQALLDVQASLDLDALFAQPLWTGMRFTIGVNNLLDETPQFAEVGVTLGYDASQGDLRGRFGYLRLTKQF